MWLFRKPTQEDVKNKAYLIYAEWGPKSQIPRENRLADKFPKISADVIRAWIEEFKRIESEIWKVAQGGGPQCHTFRTFRTRMSASFPFLNRAALKKAWFLVRYYTWHEGYGDEA